MYLYISADRESVSIRKTEQLCSWVGGAAFRILVSLTIPLHGKAREKQQADLGSCLGFSGPGMGPSA